MRKHTGKQIQRIAFVWIFACGLTLFLAVAPAISHDAGGVRDGFEAICPKKNKQINKNLNQHIWMAEAGFDALVQSQLRQWDSYKQSQQKQWEAYKQTIEEKWNQYVTSSRTIWVEYNSDVNIRSIVDFKKGKIRLEALVPSNVDNRLQIARQKIVSHLRQIIDGDALAQQVANRRKEIVTPKNVLEFARQEITPRVKKVANIKSKDGIMREKYMVSIELVSDHLQKRARKYWPIVREMSGRYRLQPELIMAIMHTESCFNPMARSSCGAVGLMQIAPQSAGRDVYRFLNGKDGRITVKELYHPKTNIQYGTAYLYLLKTQQFSNVPFEPHNNYLAICGYNWGPGNIHKKIVNKYDIQHMSKEALFNLLLKRTPAETRGYLKNVSKRISTYKQMILFGFR